MTHSGYIDWHRLSKTAPWINTGEGRTFVYAYWLADHGRAEDDHGVTLLKSKGEHPDWFLNTGKAEQMLFSVLGDDDVVASPNVEDVYELSEYPQARPMIAAVLLGTAKAVYGTLGRGQYWWCAHKDLTRPGRKLVKQLSMLYLRAPVIITFLDLKPMGQAVPEADRDSATVTQASGAPQPAS